MRNFQDWLNYQKQFQSIKLGLKQVRKVWMKLHPEPFHPIIITVAGTNGKGSCAAFLETILIAASWRVGVYSSPHLIRYNERIRINSDEICSEELCNVFERIEKVKKETETALTYFENATITALYLFSKKKVDVAILEVGLGGRLDAVNLLDCDGAIISSIGLDHQQWLGKDRESIAQEKAGIMRFGKPIVFGEVDPPKSILDSAIKIGAELYFPNNGYSYHKITKSWNWQCGKVIYKNLPLPKMQGAHQLQNAAAVITILHLLSDLLTVPQRAIRIGIKKAYLPGRFQIVSSIGYPTLLLDVAHNYEAVQTILGNLSSMQPFRKISAVFSMYMEKMPENIASLIDHKIDVWHLCSLPPPRGINLKELVKRIRKIGIKTPIRQHNSVEKALYTAYKESNENDAILIFGSFKIVGKGLDLILQGKIKGINP